MALVIPAELAADFETPVAAARLGLVAVLRPDEES
jgi:hypothetical protein